MIGNDDIIYLIKKNLVTIVESDEEYYKGLKVFVTMEEQDVNEKERNAIYVVVKTQPATLTYAQVIMPEEYKKNSDWTQGYGYQMWRCRHNAFRADGANGQYIIVIPDKNAVIVTTAAIEDMQAEINLIWDHILPVL